MSYINTQRVIVVTARVVGTGFCSGRPSLTVRRPLIARVVFHREGLNQVVITDADGAIIEDRPIPEHVYGPDAWDRALLNAGFRRLTDWRRSPAGFKCQVEVRINDD
jgi:hypothetical protein